MRIHFLHSLTWKNWQNSSQRIQIDKKSQRQTEYRNQKKKKKKGEQKKNEQKQREYHELLLYRCCFQYANALGHNSICRQFDQMHNRSKIKSHQLDAPSVCAHMEPAMFRLSPLFILIMRNWCVYVWLFHRIRCRPNNFQKTIYFFFVVVPFHPSGLNWFTWLRIKSVR